MLKQAKVEDRDIKVFNAAAGGLGNGGKNLKQYLMDLEAEEQERLKNLKLTEDKLD